ncbi:MAG: MarR family winged helix-turn-helix transcriptional regulator [Curvibacter sp.]|jgi:DNA-binding MarR family transcriptional regulator|nr:MarR family transcriptional regulator [Curvibacter sp.]
MSSSSPRVRRKAAPAPVIDTIDTRYLESLVGYNARRASLVIIDAFLRNMAVYGLRPVDFSVLSLICHNPGITSRQLCAALDIQPPNLVGMINQLEKRSLITRRPHPSDGRAMGLHLTSEGRKLTRQAEATAAALEEAATARLSPAERQTLIKLLKKIYV